MKILVTGGFGFLGSNLIRKLLMQGHEVTVIDDLSTGSQPNNKEIHFYEMPVENPSCDKVFEGGNFDAVVHLAFKGFDQEIYEENSDNIFSNNMGLNNILNLSLKYKVKKFILVSSFKVYGERGPIPFTEGHTPEPSDAEGQNYLSREVVAREYLNFGLNIVILRAGAVYGNGQYGSDLSYVKDDQKSIGDLIYIDDFSSAISKVLLSPQDSLFNLSHGEGEGNIMDSSRIKSSLGFIPETNWNIGRHLARNLPHDEGKLNIKEPEPEKTKSHKDVRKDKEVILLFGVTVFLSYLLNLKMEINVDLFILFIVFVSLMYGLKASLTSIFLSLAAHLFFTFYLPNKTILMLANDTGRILYLTGYFIIGMSVGFAMDERRNAEADLLTQIDELNEKLLLMDKLYEKSLEIKNNLRSIIENYDNNLSKVNSIVERIVDLPPYQIEDEIPGIFRDYFQSQNVSYYTFDGDKSLTLRSHTGEDLLGQQVSSNGHDFIQKILDAKDVFVNKDFRNKMPRVSIPIYREKQIHGFVFLGDVNFKYLNQLYINKLRLTASLISNLMKAKIC